MNKVSVIFGSTLFAVAMNSAMADNPRTGPRADFNIDELVIPCLEVIGFSEETEGKHFQVTLSRRGKSFNYELSTAEPDDDAVCIAIENYADYIDDETGESDILVECSFWADRSKVSVKAQDLEEGEYYAVVESGGEMVQSDESIPSSDEVEFDFDSDETEVLDGATEILPGFIVGDTVIGRIFMISGDDSDDVLVLEEEMTCIDQEALEA